MTNSSPAEPANFLQRPFTRMHALTMGYTKICIEENLTSGRWVALHRGVYVEKAQLEAVDKDTPRREVLHVAAATLAMPGVVGSHESAALIHQFAMLRQQRHVTVARFGRYGSTRSTSSHVRVRVARMFPEHLCSRYGVPLTSPARTVIDLARNLSFKEGVVIADAAMRVAGVTEPELHAMLLDCAGAPGIRRARDVVAFADAWAESVLESLARVLFARHKLPSPETQVVLGGDGPIGRVDFYWRRYNVVVEVDGMVKYQTKEDLVAEKLRQEHLENAGFIVLRFTWYDIVNHSERTVMRIHQAFARATSRRAA